MYFVQRGFVEVVSEHAEPIIFAVMEKGRFFGEISVVFSCPRTASVRCEWLIVSPFLACNIPIRTEPLIFGRKKICYLRFIFA